MRLLLVTVVAAATASLVRAPIGPMQKTAEQDDADLITPVVIEGIDSMSRHPRPFPTVRRQCDTQRRLQLLAVAPNASAAEYAAASMLATFLGRLVAGGAPAAPALKTVSPLAAAGKPHVAIGTIAAQALGLLAGSDLADLGNEDFILSTNRTAKMRNSCAVVLVGAPNSTIAPQYAAQQLLRMLGVRFLAWDEILVPKNMAPLPLDFDIKFVPTFEYRDIDGWSALANPQQAQYMHLNGAAQASASAAVAMARFDAPSTGTGNTLPPSVPPCFGKPSCDHKSPYASPPGFVHTSYTMLYDSGPKTGPHSSNTAGFPPNTNCSNASPNGCPPAWLFRNRNEWFWPRDDGSAYGQLCWSNASLVEYLAIKAEGFLSMQPDAKIISISQNDGGPGNPQCESPEELAIVKEEGSAMGPMLRAVNTIARRLQHTFPNVAVDTLAYQNTVIPPKLTRPEPNVIIRLCDSGPIASKNLGAPVTDPSNKAFAAAIDAWSALTPRVYVWNYVVDFGNLLQPLPNYFALGPNIRWFATHGVRGVFEEGPGLIQGDGSDLEELKDFVMGEMLWDPTLDPNALISEFLDGYYGTSGASFVRLYMVTMHNAINNTVCPLVGNCLGMPPPAGVHKTYLTPNALLVSASAFSDGVNALTNVTGTPSAKAKAAVYRARLERASMAILYPVLWRWDELRRFAANASMKWPLPAKLQGAFDQFARIFNATGTMVLTDRTQKLTPSQALAWLHTCVFAPPHQPGRLFGQDCCPRGQDQNLCRPGAPPPPSPPMKSCKVETGFDWRGTEVCKSNCAVSVKDSEACCTACNQKPACKVGVFVGTQCYLKTAAEAQTKYVRAGRTSCMPTYESHASSGTLSAA